MGLEDTYLKVERKARRQMNEELHPELKLWLKNVGPSVLLHQPASPASTPRELTIISWNMFVGRADLEKLLEKLSDELNNPLIVIAQEVYRESEEVPKLHAQGYHARKLAKGKRHDIVELAKSLKMDLWYVPSMRNGPERSDRGNAILSTLPIKNQWSFTLPHVMQRRVVVAVELEGIPEVVFVSSHLDTHGHAPGETSWRKYLLSGRAYQSAELAKLLKDKFEGKSILLGSDLNTPLGPLDPAFLRLIQNGFAPALQIGAWFHTFHGFTKLRLDHFLFKNSANNLGLVEATRLDEKPKDKTKFVFGSDHHPLLIKVKLET